MGTGIVEIPESTLLEQPVEFGAGVGDELGGVIFGGLAVLRSERRNADIEARGVFFEHANQTLGAVNSDVDG